MRNLLAALALLAAVSARAYPGPQINGGQINPQSAISVATFTVTGAAGLKSNTTATVNVDGQTATAIPNAPLQVTGSANTDVQVVLQNKSNGANANAGFFFMADNGTNSTNSGWCGINGSGYSGSANGWFDGPDDAVCYALSGNMGLGAAGSGKVVNIFAGGTAAANIAAIVASTGTSIIASGFSVGGSSFTVVGGTATAAYQLSAQNVRVRSVASGTQCAQFDASGNLSGTGSGCASTTGFVTAGPGAAGGGSTRWTSATTISTGAFTDNGSTVTAPAGSAFFMAVGSTFTANNAVHMSSCSYNFTAVGPANGNLTIGFSTVTITIPVAMKLRVWYSGSLDLNATGSSATDSFLLDGGYDTGLGVTKPIVYAWTVGSGGAPQNGSYSWITTQQAAGPHSVTFTLASPGTGIPHACASTAGTTACQFCVEAVQ